MPGATTNFDDEPPLLEELGIDFNKIYERTISVLNPMKKVTKDMLYSIGHDGQQSPDSDMAGPLMIALMLGGAMLLRGKVGNPAISLAVNSALSVLAFRKAVLLTHIPESGPPSMSPAGSTRPGFEWGGTVCRCNLGTFMVSRWLAASLCGWS